MIARLFYQAYRFRVDSASMAFNEGVAINEDMIMNRQVCSTELGRQLLLVVLLLGAAMVSRAEPAMEPRLSTTSQGKSIQRGSVGDGLITHDEYEAFIRVGVREKPVRATAPRKLASSKNQNHSSHTPNTEFWFYDVDVELFSDFDNDGYFYGIDLWFDIDTVYSEAEVYAVIYLSYEYGPWNEYAATEDFTIHGASGADDYVIETELISGYETGSYDILIDVFDVYDGTLVATIGPEDSSELSLLPLEDSNRDAVGQTVIIVNSSGGGSVGWLLLLVLTAGCLISRLCCVYGRGRD